MKEINSKVGKMYYSVEDNNIELCDTNKEFIGRVYCFWQEDKSRQEIINETIKELENITDITDLVKTGVCENMVFGKSIKDVIDECNEYINGGLVGEEFFKDFGNIVGDNYFIVDYTEVI